MPIPSIPNQTSAKPNRVTKLLESKETKKSKKFVKDQNAGPYKEVKSLQTATEKSKKLKAKANNSRIPTNPDILKSQDNVNASKKTECQVSEIANKTESPLKKKTIRISVSRNEVIPNSSTKVVKKVSKPKSGKPINNLLKRSSGGTHGDKKDNSSWLKKETKKKKIAPQNHNLIKSSSEIQKQLRIKSEQAAMQSEILEHQKIKLGKLTKNKDLENKKKIKTDLKTNSRSPIPAPTEAERKKNKSVALKAPTDSVRRKQRERPKNLSRKIVEEKMKKNTPVKIDLKKDVKHDSAPEVAEAKTPEKKNVDPSINKEEKKQTSSSLKSPSTQEAPSTSVARPDLLKFVRAMKENVQFESLQPGTESYQDLVQSTLKSVFSTVNKYQRKDHFEKFRNCGKHNDDALMITPNLDAPSLDYSSQASTASQMFQQRANIAQTSQPFQCALKESKYAELKFLEKRKAQAQPEKLSFLKSLHVGPNFSENSTTNILQTPNDDLKTVPSETGT